MCRIIKFDILTTITTMHNKKLGVTNLTKQKKKPILT